MTDFIVLRDCDGGTYAGETWAAALEAATPDRDTRFCSAALVSAPDAGAARLLLDNNGARRQTLAPPVRFDLVNYDANDIRRAAEFYFLSTDMTDDDIRAVVGLKPTAEIEWSGEDIWEIANGSDGEPLGRLEHRAE